MINFFTLAVSSRQSDSFSGKNGPKSISDEAVLKGSPKQTSVGKEDHASVHPAFFKEAVEGCREFLIGDVIDLGEAVKAAWMAMHFDNARTALPYL
jgi:hypothetical protein